MIVRLIFYIILGLLCVLAFLGPTYTNGRNWFDNFANSFATNQRRSCQGLCQAQVWSSWRRSTRTTLKGPKAQPMGPKKRPKVPRVIDLLVEFTVTASFQPSRKKITSIVQQKSNFFSLIRLVSSQKCSGPLFWLLLASKSRKKCLPSKIIKDPQNFPPIFFLQKNIIHFNSSLLPKSLKQ